MPYGPLRLRNYRQREIVSIAAFITCLELVATGSEGGTISQFGEGAADRCRGGVADDSEDRASRQPIVRHRLQVELRAAPDAQAIGNQLVGSGLPGVELAGVTAIGFESQRTLDSQGGGPGCSGARGDDRARAAARADCHRSCDRAFAAKSARVRSYRSRAGR